MKQMCLIGWVYYANQSKFNSWVWDLVGWLKNKSGSTTCNAYGSCCLLEKLVEKPKRMIIEDLLMDIYNR